MSASLAAAFSTWTTLTTRLQAVRLASMMKRSQIPAREEERVPLHNEEARGMDPQKVPNKTQVMNRAAV